MAQNNEEFLDPINLRIVQFKLKGSANSSVPKERRSLESRLKPRTMVPAEIEDIGQLPEYVYTGLGHFARMTSD
jgi:hypothetical protein